MTRVLVIDDEELVRNAFRLALERAGFETVDFGSGREAMKLFQVIAPDLVIVDLVMPDQDGFETIAQIQRANPEMPIIAITGGGPMGPDQLIQRVSAMGIGLALKKPVERQDLLAAVRTATGLQ
jgi:two-component system, chemotaxis family, chemotaxis protein CheY